MDDPGAKSLLYGESPYAVSGVASNSQIDRSLLDKYSAAISRIQLQLTPIQTPLSSSKDSVSITEDLNIPDEPTHLLEELKQAQSNLRQAQSDNSKQDSEIRLLTQDRQVSTDKMQSLVKSLKAALTRHSAALNSEYANNKELKLEVERLDRANRELVRNHEDYRWRMNLSLNSAHEQKQSLTGDIQRYKAALEKIQQRLHEQKEDFHRLSKEKEEQQAQHEHEIRELQRQVGDLELLSKSRKEDYDHLLQPSATKVDSSTEQLASRSSKISALTTQSTKIRKEKSTEELEKLSSMLELDHTGVDNMLGMNTRDIKKDLLRVSMLETEKELSELDAMESANKNKRQIEDLNEQIIIRDHSLQALKQKLEGYYEQTTQQLDTANTRVDHLQRENECLKVELTQQKKESLLARQMRVKAKSFVEILEKAESTNSTNDSKGHDLSDEDDQDTLGLSMSKRMKKAHIKISKDALEIYIKYEQLARKNEAILMEKKHANEEASRLRKNVHKLEELLEHSEDPSLRENGRYLRELIGEREEKCKFQKLAAELAAQLDVLRAKNMALGATSGELKDLLHLHTISTETKIGDLTDAIEALTQSESALKNHLGKTFVKLNDSQSDLSLERSKTTMLRKQTKELKEEISVKKQSSDNYRAKLHSMEADFEAERKAEQDKTKAAMRAIEEEKLNRRRAETALLEVRTSMTTMENTIHLAQITRRAEREKVEEEKKEALQKQDRAFAMKMHEIEDAHQFELKKHISAHEHKVKLLREELNGAEKIFAKRIASRVHKLEADHSAELKKLMTENEQRINTLVFEREQFATDQQRHHATKLHDLEDHHAEEKNRLFSSSTETIESLTFKLSQCETIREEHELRIEALVDRLKVEQQGKKEQVAMRRQDVEINNELHDQIKHQTSTIHKLEFSAKADQKIIETLRKTDRQARNELKLQVAEHEAKMKQQHMAVVTAEEKARELEEHLKDLKRRLVDKTNVVAEKEKDIHGLKIELTKEKADHVGTNHILEDFKLEIAELRSECDDLKMQLEKAEFKAKKQELRFDVEIKAYEQKVQVHHIHEVELENKYQSQLVKLDCIEHVMSEKDTRIENLLDKLKKAKSDAMQQRKEDVESFDIDRERLQKQKLLLRNMEMTAKENDSRLRALTAQSKKKMTEASQTIEKQRIEIEHLVGSKTSDAQRLTQQKHVLSESKNEILKLKTCLRERDKDLQVMSVERKKLQSENLDAKHQLEDMRVQVLNLNIQYDDIKNSLKREQISKIALENDHKQEFELYLKRLTAEEGMCRELTDQNNALTIKVGSLSTKVDGYSSRVTELEQELNVVTQKANDTGDVMRLQGKITQMEHAYQLLREKSASANAEKLREVKVADDRVRALKGAKVKLECELNDMRKDFKIKLALLEAAREKTTVELLEEIQRREAFANKLTVAQKEVIALKSEKERLQLAMKRADLAAQSAKSKIEDQVLFVSAEHAKATETLQQRTATLGMIEEDRMCTAQRHMVVISTLKHKILTLQAENKAVHFQIETITLNRMKKAKEAVSSSHTAKTLTLEDQRRLALAVEDGLIVISGKNEEIKSLRKKLEIASQSHQKSLQVKVALHDRQIKQLRDHHKILEQKNELKHQAAQKQIMQQMHTNFLKLSRENKRVEAQLKRNVQIPKEIWNITLMNIEDLNNQLWRENMKVANLKSLINQLEEDAHGLEALRASKKGAPNFIAADTLTTHFSLHANDDRTKGGSTVQTAPPIATKEQGPAEVVTSHLNMKSQLTSSAYAELAKEDGGTRDTLPTLLAKEPMPSSQSSKLSRIWSKVISKTKKPARKLPSVAKA